MIICGIMASANVDDEAIADMLVENDPAGDTQEETFQSEFFGANRYNGYQQRVGNPHVNNEWQTQRRKRRRRDTSSVDAELFSQMGTDEKLLVLFNKLSMVEGKQNSLNAVLSPVHEKIDVLENCVNIHSNKVKMLSYRSLDLEARSRRNNLVFRGLADIAGEDCKKVIVTFVQEELKLESICADDIARAHRLGSLARAKARYATTRRPIIVNFKDYSLTESIMESAKLLRGTMFRVEKDFPIEISEARRHLWPTFQAERAKYPNARVVIAFPAKVVRNGRVVRDEFPDWNDMLRISRVRGFESDESSDGDDVGAIGYRGQSGRRSRPPFRPWQRSSGAELDGSTYQTAETDTGSDTSTRASTTRAQGARKKVYTKGKQRGIRRRQSLKMTERVAENLRNSKNNKGVNKLPTGAHGSKSLIQKKTANQNNRSSSVPDTTRGISNVNIGQGAREPIQPINEPPARDSTQRTGNETINDSGGVAANSQ